MHATTSPAIPAEGLDRARFIRECFADFPSFCGLLKIRKKSATGDGGRRWPMVLTPLQRQYCRARTSRDIILKPRQVYMTTLEAARDLWWFLTKPGARVVVVVQSQTDLSALKDIAEKFRIFIDSLRLMGVRLEFGRESACEWSLPKRDATMRIIQAGASESSASKKGRGGTVNRLHISEAAFFERAEDTFNSLLESVPRDGSEVVNESTPNGAGGFYYEQWRAAVNGESAYKAHFFPWWLHPEYRMDVPSGHAFEPRTDLERRLVVAGVPVGCLEWYRWKVLDKGGDERLVAQEFPSDAESCFLDGDQQYIPTEFVEQAAQRVAPATGRIFAGLDVGRTNDLTVLTLLRLSPEGRAGIVEIRTCKRTAWDEQIAMVLAAAKQWGFVRLCVDATGIGSMPAETLQKHLGASRVEPVDFTMGSKEEMATLLYTSLARGLLSIPNDPELRRDLAAIRRIVTASGNVTYDAPRTSKGHADRAWSVALALRASKAPAPHRSAYTHIPQF